MFQKTVKIFIMLVLAVAMLLSAGPGMDPAYAANSAWPIVDGNADNGLNAVPGKSAIDVQAALLNNVLYVSWIEHTSYSNYYIRVKKFDGANWELIDGGSGRNRSTSYNMVVGSSIIAFDNAIYLAWTEGNSIYVDKYQDGTWTSVDGGYINRNSGSTANYPELAVYNNKLYISWQERNSSYIEQLRVKRYDGGTTWTFVDGNGENGLNYNIGYKAQVPCSKAFGANLYVAFFEYDGTDMDLRVKKYDGITWSAADTGNLNVNTFNSSSRINLESYGGSLYMTWIENGNDVYTKKYDGTSWVLVDEASSPTMSLEVYSAKLYSDGTNLYHLLKTSSGVRVRQYDGANWSYIDGGIVLNKDAAKGAEYAAMAVDSDKVFACWTELNSSNVYQTRAAWYLPLTITPTSPPLTELNLNSASLNLSFTGTTFKDTSLSAANFSLFNAPPGLTIESVTYIDENSCSVDLAFDGTDFESDISNFGVQIGDSETTAGFPLVANNLTITAYSYPAVNISSVVEAGSNTSFDITAEVTADGGANVTERGIEWKLATADDYVRETDPGSGTGSFSINLTGLTLFSIYNVRAYAVNELGTSYSDVVSFTPGAGTINISPPIHDIALLCDGTHDVDDGLVYIGSYGGDEKYALKFDLSGIHSDWIISSVSLKLFVPSPEIYGTPEVNIIGVTDDSWNETTNIVLPSTAGSTVLVTGRGVSSYDEWIVITGDDLTNFVKAQIADGNVSFLITGSTSDSTDFGVNTKESTTNRPVLSIEYTSPTYTIADIADQTLDELAEGYGSGSQETKTVTITRTGSGNLENLATELTAGDTSAFEISQPEDTALNDGTPSTTFTVKAKDSLAAGTYTATITVSATDMSDETFTVTQAVYGSGGMPTYTIANIADQTLDELAEGYGSGSQETKTVTITRTGSGNLENLAAELTAGDTSAFEISQPEDTALNDGTPSTTFTVKAKDSLAAGTYIATITVSATDMSDETFTVTQAIYGSGGMPTYTIANIADQTLDELAEGYGAGSQETKTVTITRTGSGNLENLAAELTAGDTSAFEISQPEDTSLNDGTPSTTFTVKAKDSLAAGTYIATITVSATDMSDETFTVTQAVYGSGGMPTYTIANIADQTLDELAEGYGAGSQETKTVTITRTGSGNLENLAAELTDGDTSAFEISQPEDTALNDGIPSTTFTVKAKDGLAAGTYIVTITVSATDMSDETFTVTQAVSSVADTVISTAAIAGVTAPVKGAAPVTTIADTAEYTATISWSPADATFAASTVYTATITIIPKAGYTLTGVAENFFIVTGATATNEAGSGVVTAVFPATLAADKYTVTFNVNGGSPVSAINDVVSGSTITAPASPTRAGYEFAGWYKNAGLTMAWNFTTDRVTANTTLYARWTATHELTVPNFSIASQSIPDGSSRLITLTASGSKLVMNGVEQDAAITYTYEEVEDSSNLATLSGANLSLNPPAGSTGETVKIKAIASWAEGGISLTASRISAFTVTNQGAPPCTCIVTAPVFSINNQIIPYNENKTLTLAASGAKLTGGCQVAGHAGSEISYSYTILSGNLDSNGASIASIDSNVLTLNPSIAGTYTITVQATATANSKTAGKTASFMVIKEPSPPVASCTCSVTSPGLAGANITIASGESIATLDLSGKLTPGSLAGGCLVPGHSTAVVNHIYTIKSGYNTAGAGLNGKTLTVTRAGSVTITVCATANGKTSDSAEATYTVINADVSAVENLITALPVANSDTPSNDDTDINNASAAILAAKTDFENLTVEEKEQTNTAKRNKLDTLISRLGLLQTSIDASKAGGTVTANGLETAVNTAGDLTAGNNVNITLTVEAEGSISQDNETEADSNIILASAGSEQTLSSAFDVRLLKTVTDATGNITTENISEADAPVYVTMEVPAGMRGGTNYIIYHVHTLADGSKELETIEATYNANSNPPTISFWIREFSTIKIAFTPASGGNSSHSHGSSSQSDAVDGVDILVNGKTLNAGTAATSIAGGQSVTTITLDTDKLEAKLAAEGNNAVVTIPVSTGSDIVAVELTGQMVKYMENKQAVLEVKTDAISYTFSAQQINIDVIAEKLEQGVDLNNIIVQIQIAYLDNENTQIVENIAKTRGFTIVAPAVNFAVTCNTGDKTIDLNYFSSYVKRTIAIPDGVDPKKVTTGVIVEVDGTVGHVPTKTVAIDSKYYAEIHSLMNNTYLVIYNPKTFKDVENHWAREAVNDMGSRLIINGTGGENFAPDRDITRAEFASILVNGLGLMQPGTGKTTFKDVSENAWYYDAVSIAYENDLISGIGNDMFAPMDRITREQAMTMVERAMKITGLKTELTDVEENDILQTFKDSGQSSDWARRSIAACIETGVIAGRTGGTIAPKDQITRAEVVVIVQRLLQKSRLI